jgi:rare lipoprotein A
MLGACSGTPGTHVTPPESAAPPAQPPAEAGLGARVIQPTAADGPPPFAIDVDAIPDAVPRAEPLSRHGNPPGYHQDGIYYQVLRSSAGYVERGIASWYGTKFHGQRTSSGEPYDMLAMTAAHPTLPLPTYVRVTNLENGRSVVVRVNDRGPFLRNRLIDLSYAAAAKLDITAAGTGLVEVRALDPGAPEGAVVAQNGQPADLYLQVGAFSDPSNAERLQSRLMAMPLPGVSVAEGRNASQIAVYRVRVGPLTSVEEADRAVEALATLGIEQPHFIVE